MKLIFIFFLLSTNLMASELLKCLGKEESSIHKQKISGPYKSLNESMISKFIQLNERIKIKPALLDQVCERKQASPGLELLKLLLLKKEELFLPGRQDQTEIEQAMDKNAIKNLIREAHYIFINFLNAFQAQASSPKCVEKNLPEVREFYYKTRYTLEDTSIESLFSDSIRVNKLFQKLKNKKLFHDC